MRILFVTCGGVTVGALAPLAAAARTAGHEVIVVSEEASVRSVVELGLPGLAATPLTFVDALFRDRDGNPVDIPVGPDAEWKFVGSAFGRLAASCVPTLAELAKNWHPDVVVGGTHGHAAALIAHQFGIPYVRQSWDIHARDERGVRAAAEELAPELAGLGLDALPEPDLDIEITPPSVLPEGASHTQMLRWTPGNNQRPLEPWMYTKPACRRVVITSGSRAQIDPEGLGEPFFGRVVDSPSLRTGDVEIVIATSDEVAMDLARRYPDVRAGWVPLDVVIRTADLLVHHGGGVTGMMALSVGVPQLVLPVIEASAAAFHRVDDYGASITLGSDGATTDEVSPACAKLLSDPSYRDRARELAHEIVALPAPHEVVDVLVRLAGR